MDGPDSRGGDSAKDATLLTRDEYAARAFGFVAAIALVDIGTLDRAAGQQLNRTDDAAERMSVIRIARHRHGVQHELTTGNAGVGGDDRDLDADLWTTPALQEESTKGYSGLILIDCRAGPSRQTRSASRHRGGEEPDDAQMRRQTLELLCCGSDLSARRLQTVQISDGTLRMRGGREDEALLS